MTPAAVSVLAWTDGSVRVIASNERYRQMVPRTPAAAAEHAGHSQKTGAEVAFVETFHAATSTRHLRFRIRAHTAGRLICVAEDITSTQEAEREVARQRTLLHRSEAIDPLTGSTGRRRFFREARLELKRSQRHGIPLALILIDLDRFAQLNDVAGYVAGDEALRGVAEVLRSGLRDTDLIGRIGGDAFALLLLHTTGSHSRTVADRLRETVAVRASVGEVALTVSAGVAEYRPGESLESLLERAEKGLYVAKAQGRDRVILAA